MAMPPLPQFNKKKEATFGIVFRKWIKSKGFQSSGWELKQTETDSIAFNVVKDKQVYWMLALSSEKGALIRVIGATGEPDYIWGRNMPCHVFIKYPKGFVGITIRDFVKEKKESARKSLTWSRAKEIATFQ